MVRERGAQSTGSSLVTGDRRCIDQAQTAFWRSHRETAMKIALLLACLMISSGAFAECARNYRGETVCGNGESAGGYNRSTGTAWTSQTNQNGVHTTQTSRGGEAKTENGKGVVHGAGGKTCYRTANSHGCD
jgi:hypothetical protein